MDGHNALAAIAGRATPRRQVHWIGPIQYDEELTVSRRGRRVTLRANADRVCVEVRVNSSVVFAAGAPGMMTRSSISDAGDLPIYWGSDRFDPRPWLADATHRRLLDAVPLAEGRRLDVVRNRLVWEGLAGDLGDGGSVVDRLLSIAERLPAEARGPRVIRGPLSPDLDATRSLVGKWAVSDDKIRAARLTRASNATLTSLWATVGPSLSAIEEFIEAHPSRAEDGAVLGNLAQAALEARAILADRGLAIDESSSP